MNFASDNCKKAFEAPADTYNTCHECESGYLKTIDQTFCFEDVFSDCKYSDFEGKNCYECDEGYALFYDNLNSRYDC